jgi:hypothetical protein
MKLADGVLLVAAVIGSEDNLTTGTPSTRFVGDVEEVRVLLE